MSHLLQKLQSEQYVYTLFLCQGKITRIPHKGSQRYPYRNNYENSISRNAVLSGKSKHYSCFKETFRHIMESEKTTSVSLQYLFMQCSLT